MFSIDLLASKMVVYILSSVSFCYVKSFLNIESISIEDVLVSGGLVGEELSGRLSGGLGVVDGVLRNVGRGEEEREGEILNWG